MTARDIPVSVAVPIKNEERNLERCLIRLRRFQEIIVIDSASTDRSVEIAARHADRVLQFKWNGQYPKKRNWLLINHQFATEWVLFLDADELANDAFCDEVAMAVSSTQVNGFWLNYTNYFLKRPLRHGLSQRKFALLRVGAGLFERIDEASWSALDMEVHEHPIVAGKTGEIRTRIDHLDDQGVAKFIERHLEYAKWEAARRATLKAEDKNFGQPFLTQRQRFKYRHMMEWWYPLFYFFFAYGIRQGFRDGYPGLAYVVLKCWYFSLIQILAREAQTLETKEKPP